MVRHRFSLRRTRYKLERLSQCETVIQAERYQLKTLPDGDHIKELVHYRYPGCVLRDEPEGTCQKQRIHRENNGSIGRYKVRHPIGACSFNILFGKRGKDLAQEERYAKTKAN